MRKVFSAFASKEDAAIAFLVIFLGFISFFAKERVSQVDPKSKRTVLSGIIEFKEGCTPGYYRIVLNGLLESSGFQVETQSDSTGHFTLTVPPGKYVAQAVKDDCGAKEVLELEKNTEHMYTFVVQESKGVEKVGEASPPFPSRLPASVLVPQNNVVR